MFRIKSKVSTSSGRPPQARHLYELSEIQKGTNDFDKSSVVGKGGFGNVHECILPNGDVAAAKRLNPESNQGDKEFEAEVKTLFTLRHRNLVSMIGYCKHEKVVKSFPVLTPWNPVYRLEKEMILLYEYMPKGTLKELLHKCGHHVFFAHRLGIIIDISRGLHYLHKGTETGTIHRDIKSSNVLFDKNGTAKISDFGMSKMGPSDGSPSTMHTVLKGSFGYMDPDYTMTGRVTRKSDVYSLGVVMLEVLCRKLVLDTSRDDDQRNLVSWVQESIRKGNLIDIVDSDIRDEISSEILVDFYGIIDRCLHKLPEERPDMSEVVASLETLQRSFNNLLPLAEISVEGNPTSPSPDLKIFTLNNIEKATSGFSENLSIDEESDLNTFLGWVDRNTLAPSNHVYGMAVAVQRVTSDFPVLNTEMPEEVNFLGNLAHPNIIRLLGCCNGDDYDHMLVYEHVKKSLSHFIHGDEPLPWITRINIMIGVARAMIYLYTVKGVLCHFKCNGILLDEALNPKLGSFGWAKHNPERVERRRWICLDGVFGYQNAYYPTLTGGIMQNNDITSFGYVLLETITGNDYLCDFVKRLELLKAPAPAPDIKLKGKLLKKIMDPRLKDNYPIEDAFKCVTLILSCVMNRPSRKDILRNLEEIAASNNLLK